MKRYRLTGNYGTFEITRVVEAENEDEAFCETGIMSDLVDIGWEIVSAPDGEEWEIEEVPIGERTWWEPTHISVNDGSGIRVLGTYVIDGQAFVQCENECGDRWDDPADQWEEVT